MLSRRTGTVTSLGVAQTLAWASSFYLPAMLAGPMARDLGVQAPTVFAAFSVALVVAALLGPRAGRAIDHWGGRPVLMASNGVFALGLAGLGASQGPVGLFLAWIVLGIGMGGGLYEAAFAALVRLYGRDSRASITGITLVAGFASTVGWPLSTLLEVQFGWRGACFVWAALHLLLGLPLNALLPRAAAAAPPAPAPAALPVHPAAPAEAAASRRAAWILSFAFAATWFASTAMAAHLPRLLQATGASLATAVFVGALIGPAQVGARLLEFGLLQKVHPLLSARLAAALHPAGAALLMLFGAPAAVLFGVLHGAGNGLLTIAKGTLPLSIFGPAGYGHRQAMLMVPGRMAQAAAPWLFGLALDRWGRGALGISALLSVAAFVALLWLPRALPAPASASAKPAA